MRRRRKREKTDEIDEIGEEISVLNGFARRDRQTLSDLFPLQRLPNGVEGFQFIEWSRGVVFFVIRHSPSEYQKRHIFSPIVRSSEFSPSLALRRLYFKPSNFTTLDHKTLRFFMETLLLSSECPFFFHEKVLFRELKVIGQQSFGEVRLIFVVLTPDVRQIFQRLNGRRFSRMSMQQMKKKAPVLLQPSHESTATRGVQRLSRTQRVRLVVFGLDQLAELTDEAKASERRNVEINGVAERDQRVNEEKGKPEPQSEVNLLVEDVDQQNALRRKNAEDVLHFRRLMKNMEITEG